MKSLALRLTLLGLFVAASGVAGYFSWTGISQARQDARALSAFDAASVGAERDVLELRGAQQGYVAVGQGDQFWASKVDASIAKLRDTLNSLRGQSTGTKGQTALDSAASALQDFEQMDHRARDYARSGQKLLASDLIFANGYELTAAAASSLEVARLSEHEARESGGLSMERRRLTATGAAMAVGFFVIALLVPLGAEPEKMPEIPARPIPRYEGVRHTARIETAGLNAEEGWSAAKVVPKATPAARATSPTTGTAAKVMPAPVAPAAARPVAAPAPPPVLPPPPPAIDLPGVAALCSELARVVDTYALPAILERAAIVLDAPGIVLWIADPDGRELSPIVTYGYSQQLVARLGTLARDAENATASAFRTALLQTVKTDAVSNGAIAAPLVTPAGCVGVMAAEVRNAGETDAAKLAVATIVAAQLATLVGPPSARANARVEAAGA
jgi:hypothetical protein